MRCTRLTIVSLGALFLLFCVADARAQEPLTAQSLAIKNNLMSIKEQSKLLSAELMNLQEKLSVSEEERTRLQEKSTELSNSLITINEQLSSSYETINCLETRLKGLTKTLKILASVLLVLIAVKVVGYVLCFRGVRLPRWLDILL